MRNAVSNFSYASAAHGGCHEVVDGWWLTLSEQLPHHASAESIGNGLPEVHAVGARAVEVEVPVIGVCKKVCGEAVVVPHEAAEIVLDGVNVDVGKLLVHHKAVKREYEQVHACCLCSCYPRAFLAGQGKAVVGRVLHIAVSYSWHIVSSGSVVCHGESKLGNEFVLVAMVAAVEARVAIADGGKGSECAVDAVVYVGMSLQ